ncbi:hypothetical protein [Acetobacter nitrogenifigens]|nr:hypothetical protein [Acetobacter nitrogenifigens]
MRHSLRTFVLPDELLRRALRNAGVFSVDRAETGGRSACRPEV